MQNKLFFLLWLTVGILATPGWSRAADTGRSDDEQQIRKIEQEWLDAIVKRDTSYLDKVEASDFSITGPSGKTLSKEEDIKDTTSGETRFEKMTIDELQVRFYGDTALAHGIATVKAHTKKKDLSGKYTWTDVFVKMNGDWKAVSTQVTAIAPEKKSKR